MLKWLHMDPNQQPTPNPNEPAPAGPDPVGTEPTAPYNPQQPQNYDPNYLDTIAPAAQSQKFLSGTFGKLFYLLLGIFVLAVSLIIAFQPKDDTADLQRMSVRLENFVLVTKEVHKNLRSNNLKTINSTFMLWISSSRTEADKLLKLGDVKKTDYSREMKQEEKQLQEDLTSKFDDARLSGRLNTVYTNTMIYEIDKMLLIYKKMQRSPSKPMSEYAKETSKTISDIKKAFEGYVDDGN